MTSGEGEYGNTLGRGGLADWRLSFQHLLTTQQQGWLLHPKIENALALRKDLQFADLAAGNGVWGLAMAEKYPEAEVLCSDISEEQFPAPALRLPNTRYEVQNMFDEVPEKYRGAFDVVHLRLTVVWIQDQDKDLLIRNILSMLKPGGFVQWSDLSYPPVWIHEPDGEVRPGFPKAWLRVWKLSGILPSFEWLSQLAGIFTNKYGLVGVEEHRPKAIGHILLCYKQLLEWTMQEFYAAMIKAGVPNAEKGCVLSREEQDQDYAQGRYFAYNWQTVIARKPT